MSLPFLYGLFFSSVVLTLSGQEDQIFISKEDTYCINWWVEQCQWGKAPVEGLSDDDDSACAASGEPFPPQKGASWNKVWAQLTRCTTGFYEGIYIEVRWDVAHFQSYWDPEGLWPEVLPVFGLCVPRQRCQDDISRLVIAPLYWYARAFGAQNYDHIAFGQLLYEKVLSKGFREPHFIAPGKPELVYGTLHKERIYTNAIAERMALVETSHVSGVVCISGHLRTFDREEVHWSIRRNVLESLNFSEVRTVMVTEIGSHVPEGETHLNPWLNWLDVAPGLDAIDPDVLVNIHIPVEGHPPGRTCPDKYPMSCNAQWRRLELCLTEIHALEAARGKQFDWVVRIRPDMLFPVPLGNIRVHDPSYVHLPLGSWTDTHDTFALIPRRYADIYFNTRQYGGTEFCWDMPRKNIKSDDCNHRLKLQLLKFEVPVSRFALIWQPWDIVGYYLVRPTRWDTSVRPKNWDETNRSSAMY